MTFDTIKNLPPSASCIDQILWHFIHLKLVASLHEQKSFELLLRHKRFIFRNSAPSSKCIILYIHVYVISANDVVVVAKNILIYNAITAFFA